MYANVFLAHLWLLKRSSILVLLLALAPDVASFQYLGKQTALAIIMSIMVHVKHSWSQSK